MKPLSLNQFTENIILSKKLNLTAYQSKIKEFIKRNDKLFKPIGDNLERVKVFNVDYGDAVRGIVQDELLNNPNLKYLEKSDDTSDVFRNVGNHHYKNHQLDQALRCYTLACSFGVPMSRSLALAYSNRSACFVEKQRYDLALQDIAAFESIANEWTDEKDLVVFTRVMERKTKCEAKMKENDNGASGFNNYFKLQRPSTTVPCAEEFIGIRYDEVMGRNVRNIGDTTIEAGTLIIMEHPFAKILLNQYKFDLNHCTDCLKSLEGGGVPCEGCVFHVYCPNCIKPPTPECQLSRYLYELNMDRTLHLSLATMLQLDVGELINLTQCTQDLNSIYDSKCYSNLYNLVWHEEIITEQELFSYLTYSAVVAELLEYANYFSQPEQKLLVASLITRHLMNYPCNAHSLYKLDSSEVNEIGAGAFPLLSMINHSCDPNVVRVTLSSGLNAVITIKRVPPGGEVLDNYGVHYAVDSRSNRKTHLTNHYNFTCNCDACEENWPTFDVIQGKRDNEFVRVCVCGGELGRSCKCGVDLDELNKQFKLNVELCNDLLEQVRRADCNLFDTFNKATTVLNYFDSNFKHPYKYINIMQEVLKQTLFIASNLALK